MSQCERKGHGFERQLSLLRDFVQFHNRHLVSPQKAQSVSRQTVCIFYFVIIYVPSFSELELSILWKVIFFL
jgi:hypothetical protein